MNFDGSMKLRSKDQLIYNWFCFFTRSLCSVKAKKQVREDKHLHSVIPEEDNEQGTQMENV